jgi:hypothetical protein
MTADTGERIPQIVIDPDEGRSADALIAPLIMLIERPLEEGGRGLKTRTSSQGVDSQDKDVLQLALITFPDLDDAVEFMAYTAHESDYQVGEHLAMSIHRPLGPNEGPTGMVRFLPEAIPYLILLWTTILSREK